ncbi:Uncaracterized surface protein containing fasciclin (FAS1) repeats [Chitinophaga eiseniae]|uniref:Uncaracterized surface protein containing fasciclin (FAS1) repeats n=2 Tax=Chitinophaga eiseniae TaxID=634771 RepID=A0A1T4QJ98_9BACT|nr:Uncaracterized surface protein containing fasciclin (FAS1) repeats [Chitinophaga eiseniae]
MMTTNTTLSRQYFSRRLVVIGLSLLMAGACKKDDTDAPKANDRLMEVVIDNFNLSKFKAAADRSSMQPLLTSAGPLTVLAPSDAAFTEAGYPTTLSVGTAGISLMTRITGYHILNGNYDLNKMPFLFNQEIRTYNGGKLYVTRWVKDKDTVLTVNGSRVLAVGMKASNGTLQVIDRMLEPYLYETVTEAISAEPGLSLFSHALQRSGLSALLKGKGPYTVYAANNAAMTAYGYKTLEQIEAADPGVLAALLRYHIAADRRFVYDYILSTGSSAATTQNMLDDNIVKVQLTPDPLSPGLYNGITLQGPGNDAPVKLVKQNGITGNGVLHITDHVLKITK